MTLFVMDTKTLQKSFGMRCKELRAGLGCSQEQFANLIEMDRSYYASIEVGRRNVSLSNLKKIADGFQISIANAMPGEGSPDSSFSPDLRRHEPRTSLCTAVWVESPVCGWIP